MIDQVIASLPNIIIAAVLVVLFGVLASWMRSLVGSGVEKSGHSRHLGILIGRVVHAMVFVLGLLVGLSVVFPTFQASNLIQLLGIGGVAIGFAFKDIFQNFLAGILMLLSKPFLVGDQIAFGGFEGTVEDIQAGSTLLETYDHRRIVIPNSALFNSSVSVTTAYDHRAADCTFGVDAATEPTRLDELVKQCLDPLDDVLKIPPPRVLIAKISDGTLNVNVRWWFASRAYAPDVLDRVLRTLLKALVAARIAVKDPK